MYLNLYTLMSSRAIYLALCDEQLMRNLRMPFKFTVNVRVIVDLDGPKRKSFDKFQCNFSE
jgi:hypothetical protein